MNRPKVTEEMIREAVLKVAKKIASDPGDVESVADSICREYTHPMDGFELAKRLDKWESWDTTRDDMEELDCIDHAVDKLLKDAEDKWFADSPMAPPLPIGAKTTRGVIDHIYEYGPARYCIKENGCTQKGRFLIVNFEDVKEAA